MIYVQTYKCRLCGEVFYSAHTGNKDLASADIFKTIYNCENSTPPLTTMNAVHFCKNDGIGVADFIGYTARAAE